MCWPSRAPFVAARSRKLQKFSNCDQPTASYRPHLGKHCRSIDRSYLEQVHGEHFELFRRLVQEHDPGGKSVNELTQKLFEPETG
jgi:hypothetical protein